MNEHSWVVRLYRDGDETGYMALMNAVFPSGKWDLKHWYWEYKNNPFGSIQVFGDFNGKIVGHMGLIGALIKVEGHTVQGSQAIELAVYPGFRGQGMFLEIGKKLVQEAKNEELLISYGVPNEPAYRGHLKYGWFYVSEIPKLFNVLNKKGFLLVFKDKFYDFFRLPHLKTFLKLTVLIKNLIRAVAVKRRNQFLCSEDFKENVVNSFNEEFDDLWKEASRNYRLLVVRNAKYLNWRYARKPYSRYVILCLKRSGRIEGYVVLSTKIGGTRIGWKTGYVVDIFAKSEKKIHCLLQLALNHFAKENVDLVICWMMKNQLIYNCLLERGFVDDILYSQKFICRFNTDDDKFKNLYRKAENEWFFTMGDSDVI